VEERIYGTRRKLQGVVYRGDGAIGGEEGEGKAKIVRWGGEKVEAFSIKKRKGVTPTKGISSKRGGKGGADRFW